jgi:hypothetical protein
MERAMPNKRTELMALTIFALAACGVLANAAGATAPAARHQSSDLQVYGSARPRISGDPVLSKVWIPALAAMRGMGQPPLVVAQNPFSSFSLQQMPEPPVSPINPGTVPGTTAAIGGSATGTNPITGLPCDGSGSISVSGAGGLPGTTATPPPGTNETLDQIPVGTPPFSSIYGSQTNLGAC